MKNRRSDCVKVPSEQTKLFPHFLCTRLSWKEFSEVPNLVLARMYFAQNNLMGSKSESWSAYNTTVLMFQSSESYVQVIGAIILPPFCFVKRPYLINFEVGGPKFFLSQIRNSKALESYKIFSSIPC